MIPTICFQEADCALAAIAVQATKRKVLAITVLVLLINLLCIQVWLKTDTPAQALIAHSTPEPPSGNGQELGQRLCRFMEIQRALR
jgi:hypothetical protein